LFLFSSFEDLKSEKTVKEHEKHDDEKFQFFISVLVLFLYL